MRVLIDTNVYLSYILAPDRQGVITTVIAACLTLDEINLVAPPEQMSEFAAKAATKRYFRSRVPRAVIDHFAAQLKSLAELQPLPESMEACIRDPKDDYLVVYGITGEVDYLITGDQDLLVLRQVGQMQIVTPAQFVQVLRNRDLL